MKREPASETRKNVYFSCSERTENRIGRERHVK